MPNFKSSESELVTRLDKWLFFIRNLEDIRTIPSIFKDDVFIQAFEKAELSKFGEADLLSYEMNLKVYRDYKNTVDTAFAEGKTEVARNLKALGVEMEIISKSTGLSLEELKLL
jgi:predicted transposase/invertase (TIGR01784 family)